MMRHTQKQSYRGTKTTLMSLPPKSEHSIEITLSTAEKKEYDLLDNAAKTFYLDFKARHCTELSKHYLKLSQKLTPMKIACSGGRIPLGGQVEEEDKPVERNKEEVKYSDFCFTAKFNVLLRELKQAKDKDPSSKSLVFSQYSSTLNWLKEELPKHGFGFRTLSGKMSMNQRAKALYDFQSDPPTTIFLLSMRQVPLSNVHLYVDVVELNLLSLCFFYRAGNCGINLTQANRVFLMEPGFNPALEQQAIGRVYRLGQKRKVKVIRLLVKDSVETRIHEFLKHKYGGISSDAKKAPSASPEDDHNKKEENLMGPVGNIASEKPKSKILGEEFDILFGVKAEDLAKAEKSDDRDAAIPGAAPSVGII
jgi:SNF2 family DNA or RNA helicase